jgi:hypothetical protein
MIMKTGAIETRMAVSDITAAPIQVVVPPAVTWWRR